MCDNGSYVVLFDGNTAADSGEHDLSFANGAPRPTIEPVRYRGATVVPPPRVGTGTTSRSQSTATTRAGGCTAKDPGRPHNPVGESLTCRFDFGDGTTYTVAEEIQNACGTPHKRGYFLSVTLFRSGARAVEVSVVPRDGAYENVDGARGDFTNDDQVKPIR